MNLARNEKQTISIIWLPDFPDSEEPHQPVQFYTSFVILTGIRTNLPSPKKPPEWKLCGEKS